MYDHAYCCKNTLIFSLPASSFQHLHSLVNTAEQKMQPYYWLSYFFHYNLSVMLTTSEGRAAWTICSSLFYFKIKCQNVFVCTLQKLTGKLFTNAQPMRRRTSTKPSKILTSLLEKKNINIEMCYQVKQHVCSGLHTMPQFREGAWVNTSWQLLAEILKDCKSELKM